MFNICKKIIVKKTKEDISFLESTLREFCDLLYKFKHDNIEKIKDKGLKCPAECYVLNISNSIKDDGESLLESLKSIKTIMDAYKK